MGLLPQGLKALKQVAKQVGFDLRGATLNLDGGFDSTHNRKCIFNLLARWGLEIDDEPMVRLSIAELSL